MYVLVTLLHLVVANHSVQSKTKSHRVQTTTVEKADAGTLDRCLGSSVFPCTQNSSRLNVGYVPIYNNREFVPAGQA